MVVVGDVASGVDAIDIRAAVLVHDDAVIEPNTAAREIVNDRFNPDARHDEIALHATSSFRDGGRNPVWSFERLDGVAKDRFDAVNPMQFTESTADRLAEDA